MGFRGSRDDTQKKSYKVVRETLTGSRNMWQLMDIREIRNFIRSVRESELLIVPFVFQGQHNLERGKGQYLYHVSE